MPKKLEQHKSYGEKLLSLFAKLWFSNAEHSLRNLTNFLGCSKQTVIRLIDDIQKSFQVDIEISKQGKENYYRLIMPKKAISLEPLTLSELTALQMCKIFTKHLLGEQFDADATRALNFLTSQPDVSSSRHFGSFSTGSIDYTPHQERIHQIIDAMNKRLVCRITYQAILEPKAKTYYIMPLKIFSYRETLYLHARMAWPPGKDYGKPEFDPLLAVHRLKKVAMTDREFDFPEDYDFDAVFTKTFGVIKSEPFQVIVEFTGWAALHVAERTWSPDQQIEKIDEDKIRLTFTSSSDVEVVPWVLSFGVAARVIQPDWLVAEIVNQARQTENLYKSDSTGR